MLVTTGSLLVALAPILVALEQSGPHWRAAVLGFGLSCTAGEDEGPIAIHRKSNGSPLAIWDPFLE